MARIAFFPEAAFGPALNSVGIAQACQKLGHEPVFLCDPGFVVGVRGLWLSGARRADVGADGAGGVGQVLGRLHQRAHPELQEEPLRADRQLCEGLLGGDRLDRGLGREVAAGGAGRGQARPDLHRQRDPVPGHQALRRALGADHLLQRERDPRPRHPAAPLGLRRARQGLLRGLRGALQRGGGARSTPSSTRSWPNAGRSPTRSASSSSPRPG